MTDQERPLRLLVVSHSLSTGGAERFAANLVTHLDRDLFAPRIWLATDHRSYGVPSDVEITSASYGSLIDLPVTVLHLRRTIVETRPDLVLSNVLATSCLTGTALATLRLRPTWVARLGIAPGIGESWWQRLWARRLYPMAECLVANSEAMAEDFRRRHPRLAERTRAIPNPVDVETLDAHAAGPLPEPDDRLRLLWVGRLTRQKRVDLLLEAFSRLVRSHECRLRLCGDGPLREELRALATDLGVGDAVDFLGFCDNPFVEMRAADLFVLTSDYEGLPNALIEAQALGVPAVATDCSFGPDEIVEDGVTGRLVPPGDLEALTAAIRELLGAPDHRRAMGEAARRRARRRFDVSDVIPRWEGLLASAARRGIADVGRTTVRARGES